MPKLRSTERSFGEFTVELHQMDERFVEIAWPPLTSGCINMRHRSVDMLKLGHAHDH